MITSTSDPTPDPFAAELDEAAIDPASVEPNKKIVLVIPGRLFRDGIERVLQGPDRTVVASLESFDQLEEQLEASPEPDLFIVSVANSEAAAEQFAYIEQVRARLPAAHWIILSRRPAPDLIRIAGVTGKDSIVFEDTSGAALKLLAELAMLGCSVVPAELAKLAASSPPELTTERAGGSGRPSRNRGKVAGGLRLRSSGRLSEREQTILSCLIEGDSNKAIARKLHIAESTVKVHVKALLRKLHVSNRTQAAILALQLHDKGELAQGAFGSDPAAAGPDRDTVSATQTESPPDLPTEPDRS